MIREVRLASETDFYGWREGARRLLSEGVSPEHAVWRVGEGQADLFAAEEPLPVPLSSRITVSGEFLDTARLAMCHRDPGRFALLYRLLWRMQERPRLLENAAHDDVQALGTLTKSLRRDIHKMHAFVRFRAVASEDNAFVAWFEPDHRIVEAATPFFARRFATMRWSVLTPERCAHWDGETLRFSEGADRAEAPDGDALEELWRGYFCSIFNPARLKVKAMTAEMPKKYWKNLPEADLIAPLIASAQSRAAGMVAAAPTEERAQAQYTFDEAAPAGLDSLDSLRAAAKSCERCELHCHATQTVFGEGPASAALMIVGEQPGDREDIEGRPFAGPAGAVFDAALAEAELPRETVYLTNAVKHFRFQPRGKRRLHQPPRAGHIEQCRWWLAAERRIVKPRLTLAMGTTAIRALHGRPLRVEAARREGFACLDGGRALACLHPAAILRQATAPEKDRAYRTLVEDLKRAKAEIGATLKRMVPLESD